MELEDPLIALGLALNRDDVVKLINAVDDDQSGQIEFAEFMKIMSSVSDDESDQSAIYVFFKSKYFSTLKRWLMESSNIFLTRIFPSSSMLVSTGGKKS